MKKISTYMVSLLAMLSFSQCSKFLEEQSQNLAYAKSWEKLDEVMRGDVYLTNSIYLFKWLNVMDDDIIDFAAPFAFFDRRNEVFGMYTWQADPFTQSTFLAGSDDSWAPVYQRINAANIVAYQAAQLNDNPEELRRIKGEALFMRALYYFYMVNIYAKPYNKSTAATDPGVPLKITEYVEDKHFTRSTVDSVYQQIVNDLTNAHNYLADVAPRPYHADVNAVYLLQSRVYLFMQQWEEAAAAAGKFLERMPGLYDLAQYEPQTSFLSRASVELVFSDGGNLPVSYMPESSPPSKGYKPTDELMELYEGNDLRKSAFFELQSTGNYRYIKVYYSQAKGIIPTEALSDVWTMRAGEAYLNRAEALARLGDSEGANTVLNNLRSKRFLPADYQKVALSGESLIRFIRDERRRELCFEGHRWFDLRRYSVDDQYPYSKPIVHTYMEAPFGGSPYPKATLTLQPGDPAYVFPIPAQAIIFNQGSLEQNPERPDRTF